MDTSLLELNSDPYTLLNGMFATQLPPLLNNLITEHSSKNVFRIFSRVFAGRLS